MALVRRFGPNLDVKRIEATLALGVRQRDVSSSREDRRKKLRFLLLCPGRRDQTAREQHVG